MNTKDWVLPKRKKQKELILPKIKKEKKVKPPKEKKVKLPKEKKEKKQLLSTSKKGDGRKIPRRKKGEGFKFSGIKKLSGVRFPWRKNRQAGEIVHKKRILTLSGRLLLLCLLPMVLSCLIITVFSASRLRAGIESEIEKSLGIVTASVNETYSNLYEGDYSVDISGKVSKGGVLITSDNRLIDSIKEQTGFEVSFLFGNTRVITTLRNEKGVRMNGIGISNSVYERIEAGETIFQTDYRFSGVQYYTYYQPLFNADGTIVGAIEAGVDASSVNNTINSQIIAIVGFSVVFVLLAAVAVVFLSRSLVVGMTAVKAFLERIVQGELGAEPDAVQENRGDEIGDIYRMAVSLQSTLHQIVNEIKVSAGDLNESADQLINMAQNTDLVVDDVIRAVAEISEGAKRQADDTSETNENIVRMGQQITSIVGEVENLNRNANKMAAEESESERIINELNASNNETKEAVMQVAEQITVMSSSIRNITAALDMIRNVADETTLLALNASIEAARVGEAGRGFAVVAQQINKLAEQSNSSIIKIEKVIDSVISTSERMVEIMADVKYKMDQQQDKLDETMSKSVAVAGEVENSKIKIEAIRGNVETLSEFGTVIGGAVGNLAAVSYENAASADTTKSSADSMSITMSELKDASEKLADLSRKLEESLGIFKL